MFAGVLVFFFSTHLRYFLTNSPFRSSQLGITLLLIFLVQLVVGSLLVRKYLRRVGTLEEVFNVGLLVAAGGSTLMLMSLLPRNQKLSSHGNLVSHLAHHSHPVELRGVDSAEDVRKSPSFYFRQIRFVQ